VGTSVLPATDLLLSFLKYGTNLDRWYNWYIVYTTILDYNNPIKFLVCQEKGGKTQAIRDTVTLKAGESDGMHVEFQVRQSTNISRKEGKED